MTDPNAVAMGGPCGPACDKCCLVCCCCCCCGSEEVGTDLFENCCRLTPEIFMCRFGEACGEFGKSCNECRKCLGACPWLEGMCGACCVFKHCGKHHAQNGEDGLTPAARYAGKRCCCASDPVLNVECILFNYCPCLYGCPEEADPVLRKQARMAQRYGDPADDTDSDASDDEPEPEPGPAPAASTAAHVIKRLLF